MKRLLAAASLTALALAPTAAHADPLSLGGRCDGVVDTMCRDFACGPDDLDCGLVPPCFLWTVVTGCLV